MDENTVDENRPPAVQKIINLLLKTEHLYVIYLVHKHIIKDASQTVTCTLRALSFSVSGKHSKTQSTERTRMVHFKQPEHYMHGSDAIIFK